MAQWCPRCRAEYVEGWGTCSRCDVALVDTLPDSPPSRRSSRERVSFTDPGGTPMAGDEFVAIWEGPTPEGDKLVRRLEAALIPVDTAEADEPGALRLQVPESYVTEALGVLEDPSAAPSDPPWVDQEHHWGEHALAWSPAVRMLLLAAAVILVIALVVSRT